MPSGGVLVTAALAHTREALRRVDQGEVREGLRHVPEQPARPGVVLLREQADVVPDSEQLLEERRRLVEPSRQGQVLDEPERARQEDALSGREAVDLLERR